MLSDDNVRPLTDHVSVQAATIQPYSVKATVYTYAGPDSAVVLAEANARLARYVADSKRLGRDVVRSGLYAALPWRACSASTLNCPPPMSS